MLTCTVHCMTHRGSEPTVSHSEGGAYTTHRKNHTNNNAMSACYNAESAILASVTHSAKSNEGVAAVSSASSSSSSASGSVSASRAGLSSSVTTKSMHPKVRKEAICVDSATLTAQPPHYGGKRGEGGGQFHQCLLESTLIYGNYADVRNSDD